MSIKPNKYYIEPNNSVPRLTWQIPSLVKFINKIKTVQFKYSMQLIGHKKNSKSLLKSLKVTLQIASAQHLSMLRRIKALPQTRAYEVKYRQTFHICQCSQLF